MPYLEQYEIRKKYSCTGFFSQMDCKKFYGNKNVQIPLTDFSDDENVSPDDDYRKKELINTKNSKIVCESSDNESNDLPTQQ